MSILNRKKNIDEFDARFLESYEKVGRADPLNTPDVDEFKQRLKRFAP